MIDRIASGWLNFVLTHPRWILACVVVLLIGAIAGLPKLRLDASSDSLTLERDADLDYFRQMSKQYDSGDFLVVTYTPKTPLFEALALDTLESLQAELAAIQGVTGVTSMLNVPLLYSPKRSLSEISKEPRYLRSEGVDVGLAKQEFLTSPIYRKLILSPDGNTTGMILNIAVDREYIDLVTERDDLRLKQKQGGLSVADEARLEAVSTNFLQHRIQAESASTLRVQAVRDITAKYQDRAQIYLGGLTMITSDMISFIRQDIIVFGGAALAFMVLVLVVIFRSVRFVLIPMGTCITAVLMTLGVICWTNWHLTVISSNFVALLLIIALAIIIHLVVRYREYALQYPNWTQTQLVFETCNYMLKPCLYTTSTTIVAFASLVVSGIRPVIDFGWMMTIGLFFAMTLAFVLLPAVLVLLPRENMAKSTVTTTRKPLSSYCADIVDRLGNGIFILSAIVLLLSIWGISRLQVENRFVDYFHESTEINRGLTLIDQKLGGTTSLDIVLTPEAATALILPDTETVNSSDEDDPFAEVETVNEGDPFDTSPSVPEEDPFAQANPSTKQANGKPSVWMTVTGLKLIENIADYLDALPEVGKVQSLATLYKVGKDINGSLNNFELALMQQSLSPEVKDVLVSPYLNTENDETRITLRVIDTYPGLQRIKLVERIKADIGAMDGVAIEHVRFSGLLVLYNNMLQSLFSSQIVTIGVVFLGIGLMFVMLFRSVILAIVALVPNMLAACAILGGMGLVGIPLDMMTITIAAITVGIGVDDTIHYIHRFKHELAVDGDYLKTMHRAHASIGRAMYYTSIIIIFGFSIMVFSEFIPTVYFGLLTSLAMLVALAGALFLLPQLILFVRPFKIEQE